MAWAAARMAWASTCACGAWRTGCGAGVSSGRSVQAASAGRIRVDTLPGSWRATWMASLVCAATEAASRMRPTQCDIGCATASTSLVSGASYCTW
ncbi:Uncharacterised protein [Bordetella pertussis]|nr:Uncharacterised protein [Bordetella pertussis]CPL44378.1 Uncharacterised protein [Bordetella pertussis]